MKFTFIIDRIASLDPTHDSSVAMMESAQILGHEVYITTLDQLSVLKGKAYAHVYPVTLKPVKVVDNRYVVNSPWYELGDRTFVPLEFCHGVFMRKDPPVTTAYLYATYILDLIDTSKTAVKPEKEFYFYKRAIAILILSSKLAQNRDKSQLWCRSIYPPLKKEIKGLFF